MQFSAIVNRFIVKNNLILLLQTQFLEKKIFRKMSIVANLVSLKAVMEVYGKNNIYRSGPSNIREV